VGSSPDQLKPKTIKLVFVASPLSSIKENEQRLVGSDNQNNLSEGVYLWTDVSVN